MKFRACTPYSVRLFHVWETQTQRKAFKCTSAELQKSGAETPLSTFKSFKSYHYGRLHFEFNNERKKIMCYNFNTLLQQKRHFIHENRMLILRPVSHTVYSSSDWSAVIATGRCGSFRVWTSEQHNQEFSRAFSEKLELGTARHLEKKQCISVPRTPLHIVVLPYRRNLSKSQRYTIVDALKPCRKFWDVTAAGLDTEASEWKSSPFSVRLTCDLQKNREVST
jgi:hypothetical protein